MRKNVAALSLSHPLVISSSIMHSTLISTSLIFCLSLFTAGGAGEGVRSEVGGRLRGHFLPRLRFRLHPDQPQAPLPQLRADLLRRLLHPHRHHGQLPEAAARLRRLPRRAAEVVRRSGAGGVRVGVGRGNRAGSQVTGGRRRRRNQRRRRRRHNFSDKSSSLFKRSVEGAGALS